MLSLKDYTSHLKQEKQILQDYLAENNITTNSEDTFTDMSDQVLDEVGTHVCVYAQPTEPEVKYGIWFKTEDVHEITNIEHYNKFQVSQVWDVTAGLPAINTQMPLYRIVHNGYMYGFATNNCMRVNLKNPSVKEALALPKASLGLSGAFNLGSSTYSTLYISAIAEYEDEIYMLAGSADLGPSTSTSVFNDIVKYNTINNTWAYVCSVTASQPANPAPNSMVTVGDKIYLFGSGSRQGYGCPCGPKYWILDPKTNTITGPFQGPQERVGPGSVVAYQDRYIYMWSSGYQNGGSSTFRPRPNNVVHRFDTLDNTWKQLKASPLQHCGIHLYPYVIDDKILLFGMIEDNRYWGSLHQSLRYICYKYDIETDTYTRLSDIPGGILGSVVCYFDTDRKAIAVTGANNTGSVVNTTKYFYWFENENHEDNTVIFSGGLPGVGSRNINLYYNSKLDTTTFGIYFKKVYLWDESNNAPYNAEVYYGDGTAWKKI